MNCDALCLPLLEFLAYKAGCAYLSDLPLAGGWQRARLARELEWVPAEAAPLREWNDALRYLAHAPPEKPCGEQSVRRHSREDAAALQRRPLSVKKCICS